MKLSDPSTYPLCNELEMGLEAMKRVTERVNETRRIVENKGIKEALIEQVEDWKVSQSFINTIL